MSSLSNIAFLLLFFQFLLLFFGLDKVFYCNYRVTENNSWSRKTHNILYSLPHLRLIAMYFAIRAERFLIPPRAFAPAKFHIFQKLVALRTKSVFALMFLSAIQPYHQFYDFQFFTLFHNLPSRFCHARTIFPLLSSDRTQTIRIASSTAVSSSIPAN